MNEKLCREVFKTEFFFKTHLLGFQGLVFLWGTTNCVHVNRGILTVGLIWP